MHFCRITSIINQQLHLHNRHIKQFKNTSNHSDMFRSHYVPYDAHLANCSLYKHIPTQHGKQTATQSI